MTEKGVKRSWVMVNRAPVLTFWAAVVGKVLGGHRTVPPEEAQ